MKPSLKPIFIMYIDLESQEDDLKWEKVSQEYTDYIRKQIGSGYDILILPVIEQKTTVQVFYPGKSTSKEYTDLLAELGKKTALNNIGINLASGEGD